MHCSCRDGKNEVRSEIDSTDRTGSRSTTWPIFQMRHPVTSAVPVDTGNEHTACDVTHNTVSADLPPSSAQCLSLYKPNPQTLTNLGSDWLYPPAVLRTVYVNGLSHPAARPAVDMVK